MVRSGDSRSEKENQIVEPVCAITLNKTITFILEENTHVLCLLIAKIKMPYK